MPKGTNPVLSVREKRGELTVQDEHGGEGRWRDAVNAVRHRRLHLPLLSHLPWHPADHQV